MARRELALILAVVYLGVATLIVTLFYQSGITDSAIIIAVLFLPLLIYLVASGDVSEIGGPGGFKAKFREIANAPIDSNAEVEDLQLIAKADMNALETRARRLRPGVPVALSFRMGGGYDQWMTDAYIEMLQRLDPDLTVAFIDDNGIFKASSDASKVRAIINNDHFGAQMQLAITMSDLDELREVLTISTQSCGQGATNAEALKLMLKDGVKSLVVVDEQQRPIGVVRRDEIVATMLATLAG